MSSVNADLVLSVFPGIDGLGRGFEDEGYCVVRGPDLLWGGDVRRFHPPAGVFAGVIGGDPCQAHSSLAAINRARGRVPRYPDMSSDYARIIEEAQPEWFLRENVPGAPDVAPRGYLVYRQRFNNRWLDEPQNRERLFWFGTRDGRPLHIEVAALVMAVALPAVTANGTATTLAYALDKRATRPRRRLALLGGLPTVTSSHLGAGHGFSHLGRYTVPEAAALQGFPEGFLDGAPFTVEGKKRVIANAVPVRLAGALARAVRRAMAAQEVAT